jgi:hypothetical protein
VVVKHQREIVATKVNDSSDDNDDDKKVPWSGVLSLSFSAHTPSRKLAAGRRIGGISGYEIPIMTWTGQDMRLRKLGAIRQSR